MKIKGNIILYLFLLLNLPGFCGQGLFTSRETVSDSLKPKHHKKHSSEGQTTVIVGNLSMLIDAKKEEMIGNTDKAVQLFTAYTQRYPEDPVGQFELARLLSDQKKYDEAYSLMEDAVRHDPENKYYAVFLAEVCQLNENYKEAISIYKDIIEKNPASIDNYFQLAALFLMVGKDKDAAAVYDQIEDKTGITEDISIQKEKIYLHLGDVEKAENELQNLVKAFPEDSRYLSMLAEFYMGNNQQGKALEIYKKIAETDPGNPYIHMSMADFYRKTGNKEKAFEELKLGFANPNLDVDTKVTILLSFYNINQIYDQLKPQAFELAGILVQTHPANPKTWSILGDLLSQDNKYEEARNAFLKVISLDSSKYVVWEELLRIELQLNDFTAVKEHSTKAMELFPEQPVLYLFFGLSSIQLKKYEEAIKVLDRGVNLVVNNDNLVSQFYMYTGDAWHALKNPEESDKAYENSLKAKDDNPYVLNNYAYYLSLRGKDLEKAEKMAKKATVLDTANGSFEDTYGWVLFKLGHYREAQIWVEKALKDKDGSSSEVLEHYGDIQYKLGDPEKALEYWNKAKAKGEGSELLKKKISEKKLIEESEK